VDSAELHKVESCTAGHKVETGEKPEPPTHPRRCGLCSWPQARPGTRDSTAAAQIQYSGDVLCMAPRMAGSANPTAQLGLEGLLFPKWWMFPNDGHRALRDGVACGLAGAQGAGADRSMPGFDEIAWSQPALGPSRGLERHRRRGGKLHVSIKQNKDPRDLEWRR